MHELQFFNPYDDVRFTENRLPHWQQKGAVYFLTFRLADSVPTNLRNQWQDERAAWLQLHSQPWSFEIEQEYHRRFSGAMESWLDEGHGSCLLRQEKYAEVVAETLCHFDGDRIAMISFVIMPNHVHALFVQNPGWALEKDLAQLERIYRATDQ
jgi:putative transposase